MINLFSRYSEMEVNFIDNHLRKEIFIQLGIALIFFILVGLVVLNDMQFKTTVELNTYDQLEAIGSQNQQKMVQISPSEIYGSDWTLLEDNKPVAVYVLAPLEDKLVTVLIPVKAISKLESGEALSFKGFVQPLSEEDRKGVSEIEDLPQAEINAKLAPYMIDCFTHTQTWLGFNLSKILLYVMGIIFLAILWCVIRLLFPMANGANRSLAKYGDIAELKANIDQEVSDKDALFKSFNILITKTWFIYTGFFRTIVIPTDKIVWVYRETTSHYRNYIPVGKTHKLYIMTSTEFAKTISFLNGKRVDRIIDYIFETFPWVVTGYDKKWDLQWRKDRETFIKNVEAEKRKYLQAEE